VRRCSSPRTAQARSFPRAGRHHRGVVVADVRAESHGSPPVWREARLVMSGPPHRAALTCRRRTDRPLR
jgi:hypothetical protein